MRRVVFSILYLLISISGYSQITIKGKVVNINNEPLPFVNIGFIGTSIGTVSDVVGDFELIYDKGAIETSDTLKISMVGYYSILIPAESLDIENIITLNEQIIELKEVIITSEKYKRDKLGKFNISALNMSCNFSLSECENENLGSEIGRKFNLPKRNTIIDTLRFYILQNNFDTVGFRINIYSVKDNKPDKNILRQNVILEVCNKYTGWTIVDLTSNRVNVQSDIIVSVEWIYKSSNGNVLSLPISMPTPNTHYYKYGSQNTWKQFTTMTTRMELYIRN